MSVGSLHLDHCLPLGDWIFFFFFLWDLSSLTRNWPAPSAMKARSPNHRTTRESPWWLIVYVLYAPNRSQNAPLKNDLSKRPELVFLAVLVRASGGESSFSAVWFLRTRETSSAPAQPPVSLAHSTGPQPRVLGLFCHLRCYKCSLINLAKKPKGSFVWKSYWLRYNIVCGTCCFVAWWPIARKYSQCSVLFHICLNCAFSVMPRWVWPLGGGVGDPTAPLKTSPHPRCRSGEGTDTEVENFIEQMTASQEKK